MHRIKVNYMTCLSSASATFAWPAALQCSGVGQLLMFEVDQGTAGMGDAGGAGGMNVAVSMWSPQGCIGVACGGLIRSDGVALIVLRRVASAPACRTTSSEMQRYRETAISDHLTLVARTWAFGSLVPHVWLCDDKLCASRLPLSHCFTHLSRLCKYAHQCHIAESGCQMQGSVAAFVLCVEICFVLRGDHMG